MPVKPMISHNIRKSAPKLTVFLKGLLSHCQFAINIRGSSSELDGIHKNSLFRLQLINVHGNKSGKMNLALSSLLMVLFL